MSVRKRNHAPATASVVHRRSHFIIARRATDWTVTIRPRGRQQEVVVCTSAGEVNRVTQDLTDRGFVGLTPRGGR